MLEHCFNYIIRDKAILKSIHNYNKYTYDCCCTLNSLTSMRKFQTAAASLWMYNIPLKIE